MNVKYYKLKEIKTNDLKFIPATRIFATKHYLLYAAEKTQKSLKMNELSLYAHKHWLPETEFSLVWNTNQIILCKISLTECVTNYNFSLIQ